MCQQITNINKSCENNLGGNRAIYFVPLDEWDVLTLDSNSLTITDVDIANQAYTIELPPNTIAYDVNLNDNELGITEYSHLVNLRIPKRNAITSFKLKAYIEAQPDLVVVIKTNNNEYKVLGRENGLNVRSADGGSGLLKSEGSFYTITLEGIEREMEYDILSSVFEAFI